MVRAVGLEPTRISTADFESAASTVSPRPQAKRLMTGSEPTPNGLVARF